MPKHDPIFTQAERNQRVSVAAVSTGRYPYRITEDRRTLGAYIDQFTTYKDPEAVILLRRALDQHRGSTQPGTVVRVEFHEHYAWEIKFMAPAHTSTTQSPITKSIPAAAVLLLASLVAFGTTTRAGSEPAAAPVVVNQASIRYDSPAGPVVSRSNAVQTVVALPTPAPQPTR